MSRIGRQPVLVPENVEVEIQGTRVRVKGPKGVLEFTFPAALEITFEPEKRWITVKRLKDDKWHKAMHGTARAMINNMVVGVSQGFEKVLEIHGVGYRAEMQGKNLVLHVGFSHPVVIEPPEGITFATERISAELHKVRVRGYDKALVGQVAANIRKVRPPEPYKGKGIRYEGEAILRKAGKTGKR